MAMDDAFVKTKGSIISPNLNFMGSCGKVLNNKAKLTGSTASSVMASVPASSSNTSFVWSQSSDVSKSVADGIFAIARLSSHEWL